MPAVPRYQAPTAASKARDADMGKRAQKAGRKPSTTNNRPRPANNAHINGNGVVHEQPVEQLQPHPPTNGQMLPPPVPKSASRPKPRSPASQPVNCFLVNGNGVHGGHVIDPQLQTLQVWTGQVMPPPAPRPAHQSLPRQSVPSQMLPPAALESFQPVLKAPGPSFKVSAAPNGMISQAQ